MSTYPRQALRAAVAVVAATALGLVGVHAFPRGPRHRGDHPRTAWSATAGCLGADSRHTPVAGVRDATRRPGTNPGGRRHQPCDRPVQAHAEGFEENHRALVAGRERIAFNRVSMGADSLQDDAEYRRATSASGAAAVSRRGGHGGDPQGGSIRSRPARRRTCEACSRRRADVLRLERDIGTTGVRPGRAPGKPCLWRSVHRPEREGRERDEGLRKRGHEQGTRGEDREDPSMPRRRAARARAAASGARPRARAGPEASEGRGGT